MTPGEAKRQGCVPGAAWACELSRLGPGGERGGGERGSCWKIRHAAGPGSRHRLGYKYLYGPRWDQLGKAEVVLG